MKDKIKALKAFCENQECDETCPLFVAELKCGRGEYFDDGMNEKDINLAFDLAFGTNEEKPHIKDSGNRRQFETGAVRDIQEGKGRCDLLPLDIIAMFLNNPRTLEKHVILDAIYNYQTKGDQMSLYAAIYEFQEMRKWDKYTMILELAKHFEEGAKKYGENNWQKGIPTHCYIDSAVRHYLKWLRGDKDEPHDRAFCWNILCCIWTCENMPELNDYVKKVDQ